MGPIVKREPAKQGVGRQAGAGRRRWTAEYRETQNEDILEGIGVDPPPCWMDDESNPECIFRKHQDRTHPAKLDRRQSFSYFRVNSMTNDDKPVDGTDSNNASRQ